MNVLLQKLSLDTTIHDPHKLNEIIDPVFSDNVSVHGIKHRLVAAKVYGLVLGVDTCRKIFVLGAPLMTPFLHECLHWNVQF